MIRRSLGIFLYFDGRRNNELTETAIVSHGLLHPPRRLGPQGAGTRRCLPQVPDRAHWNRLFFRRNPLPHPDETQKPNWKQVRVFDSDLVSA